jgi:hypothetical protein
MDEQNKEISMEDINNQDPETAQEPQKPTQEPIEDKTVEEPTQEEKAPREPEKAPEEKPVQEPVPGIGSLFSQVTDEAQKFEQRLKEEYQKGFDPSVEEDYRPPSGEEVIIPGGTYEQTMPGNVRAAAQQLEPRTVTRTRPDKREQIKDYVEGKTPFGMLEHLLTSKDFTKDHMGYDQEFHNVDSYISMRVREDAAELKAAGIPFDIEEEQRSLTAELYIDTMFALGMPLFTPGPNVSEEAWDKYIQHMLNDEAFVNYVNSEEGFAEIEKGMSLLKRVRARGGASNLTEEDMKLLPNGTGAPDPSRAGLTEEEYSQLQIWDKTKYNWTAARTTFAEHTLGTVGYEADVQFREGVAPIGDTAGYIASWLVPYVAIGKAFRFIKGTARGAEAVAKLPKMKPWQVDMMRGAVADMLLARTNEENLSTILEEHLDPDTPAGALVHALAREEDENAFIAMMKDGIEGAILDRGVAGILFVTKHGFKAAKNSTVARALGDVGMAAAEAASKRIPVTKAGRRAKKLRDASDTVNRLLSKESLSDKELDEIAEAGAELLEARREAFVDHPDEAEEALLALEQLAHGAETGDEGAVRRALEDFAIKDVLIESSNRWPRKLDELEAKLEAREKARRGRDAAGQDSKINENYFNSWKAEANMAIDDEIDTLAKIEEEGVLSSDDKLADDASRRILEWKKLKERVNKAGSYLDAIVQLRAFKRTAPVSDRGLKKAWTRLKEAIEDYDREPSSEARKAEVESAYYTFLKASDVSDEASRRVIDSVPDINVPRSPRRVKAEAEADATKYIILKDGSKLPTKDATKEQLEDFVLSRTEEVTRDPEAWARYDEANRVLYQINAGNIKEGSGVATSDIPASENDIKEWRRRQRTSNRKNVDDIVELVKGTENPADFMAKRRGKNLVTRPLGTAISLVNDIRVNNILWSKGVSALALVSGFVTKGLFAFEQGAGRLFRSVRWLTRSGRENIETEKVLRLRDTPAAKLKEVKKGADVKHPAFFNMAYVLSGGTITPEDTTMDILRKVVQGLFQPSRPSRLDPAYQAQSETGRTVAAKGRTQGGIDISGRSRLAELAANTKNEYVRHVANFLVAALEFMPRTVLGTIDEGLKTGTYFKEFSDNLYTALLDALAEKMTIEEVSEVHKVILAKVYKSIEEKGLAVNFEALIRESQDELLRATVYANPIDETGTSLVDRVVDIIDEEGVEVGQEFARRQLKEKLLELKPEELEDILREAHNGATQRARQVTLTQDVPEAFEGLLRGLQTSSLGRAFSPFSRAIINALVMGYERTPLITLWSNKYRAALKGEMGPKEAERAWGKMISGLSLMGIGGYLGLREKDGIHIETTDMGSWNKTRVRVPVSDPQNNADFKEGIERYYIENKDYLDKANEVINGKDAKDTLQWLLERADEGVTEGYIDIDISRVGPWSTLINLGAIFTESLLGNNDKTVKEIENDKGYWEGLEIMNRFVEENGLADPINLFVNALEDPVGAGKLFVTQYIADTISPFKGMLSSPGEDFSPDYVPRNAFPRTGTEVWDKAMSTNLFVRIGRALGLAEKPAKQRDFLGRPLMGKERYGYLVGYETAIDPISRELEFFGIRKRPTAANEVPYFSPHDLREFDVMEIPEELVSQYGLQDATDAYDVFQILVGTVQDDRGNSAISEFKTFFESQEYADLKRAVEIYSEGDFNESELRTYAAASEHSHNAVNRVSTRITTAYKNLAAEVMFRELSPFLKDSKGRTLSQASAEAEEANISGAEALDRILEGGNK